MDFLFLFFWKRNIIPHESCLFRGARVGVVGVKGRGGGVRARGVGVRLYKQTNRHSV